MIERNAPAAGGLRQLRRVVGERPVPRPEGPAGRAALAEGGVFARLWPRPALAGADPTTRWVRVGHDGDALHLGWHPWAAFAGGRFPVVRLVDDGRGGAEVVDLGLHTLDDALALLAPPTAEPAPEPASAPAAPARPRLRDLAAESLAIGGGAAVLVAVGWLVAWLALALRSPGAA